MSNTPQLPLCSSNLSEVVITNLLCHDPIINCIILLLKKLLVFTINYFSAVISDYTITYLSVFKSFSTFYNFIL
jgi:hypothetical protein